MCVKGSNGKSLKGKKNKNINNCDLCNDLYN